MSATPSMFANVVVAVDGSPCSDRALELAFQLAKLDGGRLAICSAAYASVLYGPPELVERAFAEIHAEARHAVDDAVSKAKSAGVTASGCVLEGEPVHQILAYAKRTHADAIVVGTHGRSGVKRVLMGSVAEGLLRSADVPVVTVRAETRLEPIAPHVPR